MFEHLTPQRLNEHLKRIEKIFPELLANERINLSLVEEYYTASFWGYAIFHSWAGALHMALSRDGTFNRNDYLVQAEEIARLVRNSPDGIVAEIGCGKGFNSAFVAQCNSNRQCKGLDLNSRHIANARKKFKNIENLSFEMSDFHALSGLRDGSVGLMYTVEALCHAIDLDRALCTARRVSKPGSTFIVYDGYRNDKRRTGDLERAMTLVERAMAVPRFRTEREFSALAEKHGWMVTSVKDRSEEIMPNLIRLSNLAMSYFRYPPVSRLLKALLPESLVMNSVAGLLMPITVHEGAHRYLTITLEAV